MIKTRFAPSPTGYLHVGGARTALFSWLYARRHGGIFVLRIEDTDRERSTPESVQAILDGMQWLGLDYDEGPYYQTQRMERYAEVIEQLLGSGQAYRCYCSKERLETLRNEQLANKEKPRYDGYCRHRSAPAAESAPYVVRFRNPSEGEVSFDDQIRGTIVFSNSELDDLIIARSDGTPTYNFTVVVDDMDMAITHVIRGDDHVNNTPRQINILKALGATPPVYAHVPMILGDDGKRLSKRHGAVSVMQYREEGYLAEALLNYLVRLGWSHGDQEVFSREEMVALFDLGQVSKSAAAFNTGKLQWLNQHYIKQSDSEQLAQGLEYQLLRTGVDTRQGPPLVAVAELQRERAKTLVEMADNSRFFFEDFSAYDEQAAGKNLKPAVLAGLKALYEAFAALGQWQADAIHEALLAVAEANALKLGKLAQPLRVAVSGGAVSPPIDATVALLGRETALARLQRAIQYVEALPPDVST